MPGEEDRHDRRPLLRSEAGRRVRDAVQCPSTVNEHQVNTGAKQTEQAQRIVERQVGHPGNVPRGETFTMAEVPAD